MSCRLSAINRESIPAKFICRLEETQGEIDEISTKQHFLSSEYASRQSNEF